MKASCQHGHMQQPLTASVCCFISIHLLNKMPFEKKAKAYPFNPKDYLK